MNEIEVGDKITEIEVRLDSCGSVKEIRKEIYKVLGVNKSKFVIDNSWFTTLQSEHEGKKGDYQIHPILNTTNVADYTNDSYFKKAWGSFVISIYCTEDFLLNAEKQINKDFKKFIRNKLGPYTTFSNTRIKLDFEVK